ncbi:MAG: D-2-hydroxyacid dehydrogenase [Chitinophagaceae bacterium]|nr:D-2-hydroxyacid dehydrogenase [Chitinophagaceae bacterium]
MQIVITDGFTLNAGDLDWEPLRTFGELKIYDRTATELITERCKRAEIILTNKVPFSSETIEQLPGLKLISVLATGYNVIDVKATREKNITVCNVPAYGTASVAQHTIALLLELSNHTGIHTASVKNGDWEKSADWCYTKAPVIEWAGKTMGIVGLGNIGRQVALIAAALGMKIIYNSSTDKRSGPGTFTDLKTLFAESDVISLHCPLKDNAGFVNKNLLQLMKKTSFLINTARGQLINEQDLADALNNNGIAGAALDVLSKEPPASDNPLLRARNCFITPHHAWMSREARQRIMDTTVRNIEAYLKGAPVNVVN